MDNKTNNAVAIEVVKLSTLFGLINSINPNIKLIQITSNIEIFNK